MCLDTLALRMLQQPAPGELATPLMYRTGQDEQAALTATGRMGCATGDAVDQRKGTYKANDSTPGRGGKWFCGHATV